jgi:hypothetical protein
MAQYVTAPRATEVERRLQEMKDQPSDVLQNEISKVIYKPPKDLLDDHLKPNDDFVKAHYKRKAKEEQYQQKEEYLRSIDDQGYKIENIYKNTGYHEIHDPLNLYKNTQNYESLAWKVYQDVDDNLPYLKALYYPKLRSEDYQDLVSKFNEYHQYQAFKKKTGIIFGVAGVIGWFTIANRFRFTGKATIASSLILGVLSYYAYIQLLKRSTIRKLNNYSAERIIPKYPEIVITKYEYKVINH